MREEAEMITIEDFSPGIHSDYHYANAETPSETQEGSIFRNGAATVDDTFRCCSDVTGALVPLPELTSGKTSEPLPTGDNGDSQYLGTSEATSYLLDGIIRGDMFIQGDENAVDDDRAGVFVMYGQAWYNTGQSSVFEWTVIAQLHRLFEGSTDVHDLMWARFDDSMNNTSPIQIGSGNFVAFKGREALDEPPYESVVWVAYGTPGYNAYNGSTVKSGAIPSGEQSLTDFDTVTGTTYPGAYGRVIGMYPNFKDATGYDSIFMDNTYSGVVGENFTGCCWLIGHQGRLVGISRVQALMGKNSSDQYRIVSESIWYGPIQDFYAELGFGCYERATFGEEKPDRTGAAASITADEVIFIKDRGGAVMVRGDLENPTVVQLPYVESTRGARSIPATTPLGLVYGTRNGVFLWEGGDTSRRLSAQLEGWFWNHNTAVEYLGIRGRFGWWNPWVCVPNNWLYDTRTDSWWRLDSIANTGVSINCYDISNETNRLYAFPHALNDSNDVMWYNADPDILADTYSWQSQPLVQSRKRVITVQEVHLLTTPGSTTAATITVTLSGFDKDGNAVTPVDVTFTTNTNKNPQMLHKDVATNFQAAYVKVKIVADANNTAVPAPKIHSLSLAVADRARLAKG